MVSKPNKNNIVDDKIDDIKIDHTIIRKLCIYVNGSRSTIAVLIKPLLQFSRHFIIKLVPAISPELLDRLDTKN